jgi:hypothetical protein
MLAFIITIVMCAAVVGLFMAMAYAIIAMLYGAGKNRDLDDDIAEAINTHKDDEIEASICAMVKPVTPTGETAEIAASLEAQRRHEGSKV